MAETKDQLEHLPGKASRLYKSFSEYGRVEDLEEAIEAAELEVSTASSYVKPTTSVILGILLNQRFEHTGSMDDLNRAINLMRNAADATTHDDRDHAMFLSSLGSMLGDRFERTGSMDDLNQAISLTNEAANATHDDHTAQMITLCNLGKQLSNRFDRLGLIDDLNQAVRVTSDAADVLPPNDPGRDICLFSLASLLERRFDRLGSMDDLNRAILVTNKASSAIPPHHASRLHSFGQLVSLHGKRYQRTQSMSDLDRAISAINDLVNNSPDNISSRWRHFNDLAATLFLRFERTGSMDDLNRAVGATDDALARISYDDQERAGSLSNLGLWLSSRFEETGLLDDIDRAISAISDAVDATPHNHPMRAWYLCSLGDRLHLRFKRLNSTDDLNRLLTSYIASWKCIYGLPYVRIKSAQSAAEILIEQQDWENAYQLLHDATSLLPTMSPRSLNHTDTQSMLTYMFGLASSAAAVALRAGKTPGDALRLLELGRGVIANLLMEMRGDVTELQSKHPDLAEKFSHLREELDSPPQNASAAIPDQLSSWALQINRGREADEEFSKIIDEIRTQPGFSRFLQSPGAEDLMNAANQGPVIVVNISSFRCDAFLIQSGSIQVVELPGLTKEELGKQVTYLQNKLDLSSPLEWLWHTICRPCLDALGFTGPVSNGNWPHVWWVPTGLLSQMPLHAAGIYKKASKDTVLDRVISSYASSIKALIHGRERSIQKSSHAASLHSSALLVAMQDTPGLGQDAHLQFANAEIDMLQDLILQDLSSQDSYRKLQLTPITPKRRKDDVLEQLLKCKLFHFAGHGRSDPKNPSESCLLLEDWEKNPLTVGAVRGSRLQDNPPFLAYLSACSTGANKAARLADEGIHLISAFQLAGFQHVVGTLWEVSDKHCVNVARILYKTLQEEGMTDEAVSRGLHRAIRALRDGTTGEDTQERTAKLARLKPEAKRVVNFLWVPYVHFGV